MRFSPAVATLLGRWNRTSALGSRYLKYCVAPRNVEARVGKTDFRMLDPEGWMREIEGAPLKELL